MYDKQCSEQGIKAVTKFEQGNQDYASICLFCAWDVKLHKKAFTSKPFQKYFTQMWFPNWNSLGLYKYKLQAIVYYCLESGVVCKHKLDLLNKCI